MWASASSSVCGAWAVSFQSARCSPRCALSCTSRRAVAVTCCGTRAAVHVLKEGCFRCQSAVQSASGKAFTKRLEVRCSRLRCFPPTACVRGLGSGLCPWAAPPCQLQTRLLLRRPAPGGPGTARFSTGCCLRQPHVLTTPPGCVRPAQHRDSAPDEGRRVNEGGTAGPGRAGFLAADHRLRIFPRPRARASPDYNVRARELFTLDAPMGGEPAWGRWVLGS